MQFDCLEIFFPFLLSFEKINQWIYQLTLKLTSQLLTRGKSVFFFTELSAKNWKSKQPHLSSYYISLILNSIQTCDYKKMTSLTVVINCVVGCLSLLCVGHFNMELCRGDSEVKQASRGRGTAVFDTCLSFSRGHWLLLETDYTNA